MAFLDFLSPMVDLVGSIWNGITGMSDTQATNQANLEAVKMQNAFQKAENERAYNRQVSLINQQNEYNSPYQQMQRLKEAGLNPNLIYGNGSANTGNQSSIAKYEPAHIQRYQTNNAQGLSSFNNVLSNLGQNLLLAEQVRSLKLKNDGQEYLNRINRYNSDRLSIESKYYDNNAWIENQRNLAELNIKDYEGMLSSAMKSNISQIAEEKVKQLVINNMLTDRRISLTEQQIDKVSSEISLIASQIALNEANMDYTQVRSDIEHVLLDSGINLRDSTDRLINSVMVGLNEILGEDSPKWLQTILRTFGRGVKLLK